MTRIRSGPATPSSSLGAIRIDSNEGWFYLGAIVVLATIFLLSHRFEPSCFDDCSGYLVLAGWSVLSPEYWIWFKHMFRGFGVPVIYSIFGEHEYSWRMIVNFQAVTSFLAWIVFALAIAGHWTSRWVRFGVFLAVAGGMFSRGYLRFDDRLLSDSPALSLMLFWLSLLIAPKPWITWLHRRSGHSWLYGFLASFAVLSLFAASARDSNVFLIVFGIPIVTLRMWHEEAPICGVAPRRLALLMATAIAIAALVQWSAAAKRNGKNMSHVIAGLVLTDSARTAYFVERGMPTAITELAMPSAFRHGQTLREVTDDRDKVLGPLSAQSARVVATGKAFLDGPARRIYASYLLSHPDYVLRNLRESWDVMFDQWYEGRPTVEGWSIFQLGKFLSPFDWLETRWLLAVAVLAVVFFSVTGKCSWRDPLIQTGVILGTAGMVNSVIAFHGDLWEVSEMARHSWLGSTFLRLGSGIVVLRLLLPPLAASSSPVVNHVQC